MRDFAGSRAGRSIDFLDDREHPALIKVAQAHPELGDGAIPNESEARFIPDEQFAYVGMDKTAKVRHFPCVSPASTAVSMECFIEAADVFTKEAQHKIAKQFKVATEWHGVTMPDEIRAMLQETQFPGGKAFHGSIDKAASADGGHTHYAIMLEHPDGEVARFYALPDHGAVKTAAAYFEEWHREMDPEHRRAFALGVETRAEELGVHDLERGPALSKYASTSFGRQWPDSLEYRVRTVGQDTPAAEAYEKLAAAIASGNVQLPEAAEYLGKLDKLAGFRSGDAWDALAGVEKVAAGFSEEIDGEIITAHMLANGATNDQLSKLYGESFMKEFSKRPVEVFSSLPIDDKRVVKEVLYGRA